MPITHAADGTPHPKPIPKIHDAVFGRIRTGAHFYAPIGFPADYEVVKSTDPVVTYSGTGPTISNVASTIEPNSATIAEGAQASARHAAQEDIWDLVWRKRTIYFLTVFVTGYLLLYPLLRDSYAFQELRNPLRVVSDTIRLIGSVLPGLATRWIDAYARDPAWFLVWVFLVAFLTWISSRLAGSISDQMRLLWTKYLPASNKPAAPRAPRVASPLKSILFVGIIVYLLFYPAFREIPGLGRLALPGRANEILLAYTAQPVRSVLAAFLIFYFLPGFIVRGTKAVTHLSVDPAHIQIRRCTGSISDRHPLSRSRFRQSLPLLDPRRVRRLLHRNARTEPRKERLQKCRRKAAGRPYLRCFAASREAEQSMRPDRRVP